MAWVRQIRLVWVSFNFPFLHAKQNKMLFFFSLAVPMLLYPSLVCCSKSFFGPVKPSSHPKSGRMPNSFTFRIHCCLVFWFVFVNRDFTCIKISQYPFPNGDASQCKFGKVNYTDFLWMAKQLKRTCRVDASD